MCMCIVHAALRGGLGKVFYFRCAPEQEMATSSKKIPAGDLREVRVRRARHGPMDELTAAAAVLAMEIESKADDDMDQEVAAGTHRDTGYVQLIRRDLEQHLRDLNPAVKRSHLHRPHYSAPPRDRARMFRMGVGWAGGRVP